MAVIQRIVSIPAHIAVAAIRLYQKTLSPDTGFFVTLFPHGLCRYYPTCSEYTKRAIQQHGLLHGAVKGAIRITRCNPLSRGGYDPI